MEDDIQDVTQEPEASGEPDSLHDHVLAEMGMGADADVAATEEQPAEDPVAEQPAAEQPAAAAPAVEQPKPENELYAPLPEHNPRRTHERFAKLIDGHKQLDQKVKELEPLAGRARELEAKVKQHEEGWKVFQEMGFTSDESVQDLVQFSQYRQALSNGNYRAAAAVLQEQARQLALISGQRIDVNPLAQFSDLNERFSAGQLDEQTALELARNRHAQQVSQQVQQRRQEQQRQTSEQEQTIHRAAMEVDRVAAELMRDPDYAKVEPELLKQLQNIKTSYPPHMWAGEVKRAYETEARFLRLAAQQQSQPVQTPLRGNGHAAGRAVPTSLQDAVLQSMGL